MGQMLHAAAQAHFGPGSGQPKLRAAAIDVDGTLLDSRHQVTDETATVLKQARDAGLQIILASSRAPRAMWPILAATSLTEPCTFVASQGAFVGQYSASGQLHCLGQHMMSLADAHHIVRLAMSLRIPTNWFSGERWLVSEVDSHVRRESGIVGFNPLLAHLFTETDGPDKLMFMTGAEDKHKLAELAAMLPDTVQAQISNPTYLEITRTGVDKAAAVQTLCRGMGIQAEEVVAFGNGPNDLGLFAYAGTSIAPANARPEVLGAATFQTDSNDNHGVAEALWLILEHNERKNP
jgi:Cof subfamily protein (haloacid dehalogenase superfamily)